MPKGFKDYLAEANAQVETCSVQDALRLHGRNDWVFVDVRDAGEVEMTGKIPEAVHASRGSMAGGFNAWKAADGPIEGGSDA
jgi:rhodanese-related sulfurtransferase